MNIHVSRHLKEELAWTIDKQFQVISNKILFETVIPKAVLNLNNIVRVTMCPLITYSN